MEMTKNKLISKLVLNNEVTSNREGQKKLDHKPGVNLGSHLSELIHNLMQLGRSFFLHLKMSHQTNIISIYK